MLHVLEPFGCRRLTVVPHLWVIPLFTLNSSLKAKGLSNVSPPLNVIGPQYPTQQDVVKVTAWGYTCYLAISHLSLLFATTMVIVLVSNQDLGSETGLMIASEAERVRMCYECLSLYLLLGRSDGSFPSCLSAPWDHRAGDHGMREQLSGRRQTTSSK